MDIISRGLAAASDTRHIDVSRGLAEHAGQVLRDHLFTGATPALIVADERTWAAAGAAVADSLAAAGVTRVEPLIFPGHPVLYAEYSNAERIRDRLTATGAWGVAVGSGTINDLVKLASGELNQPYAVFGTAASMDGYTGFGAPMSRGGLKITMPCPAPAVVLFDPEIAAAAPPAMVAAGYGDLLAKIPAGADWILSDAVGIDPIQPLAWELVQGGLGEALGRPAELAAGNPEAYLGLVNGLVRSGLAMQAYRGTRPASGAEHYFSHLWELDHLGADWDPPLSHGFKVAIGTVAMTAFYEAFLTRDLRTVDLDQVVAAWPQWPQIEADIRTHFEGPLADHAVNETRAKHVDAAGLRTRLGGVLADWDQLDARLRAQLRPAADLQTWLRQVGAPDRPEQIGLTREAVRATFTKAMYYRARYSVLDLARELGWFTEIIDEVFAADGLWGADAV